MREDRQAFRFRGTTKLRQIRLEQNLRQVDLAKKIGNETQATLSQFEVGRREPSELQEKKFCEIFGVPKDYFRQP